MRIIFQKKFYTRSDVKKNKSSLYLFGENNRYKGETPSKPGDSGWQNSTQAVIRGENNTVGIRTVWYTNNRQQMEDAFLKDNMKLIKSDINEVIAKIRNGNYKNLVLPYYGIGTGVADLPKNAPITYYCLISMLYVLLNSCSDNIVKNIPEAYIL